MAKLLITEVMILLLSCFSVTNAIPKYEMDKFCGGFLDIGSPSPEYVIKLRLTKSDHYDENMDCGLHIRGRRGQRLMVQFRDIDIDCPDYLRVFSGTSESSTALTGRLCDKHEPSPVETSAEDLFLKFVSDNHKEDDGFSLLISSFHTGYCTQSEFACDNGRCIDYSLYCNDYDNCGDGSDDCKKDFKWWVWMVVGIVVFLIFLIAFVVVCCCFIKNSRSRKKRAAAPMHYSSATQAIHTVTTVPGNPWYRAPQAPSPAPTQQFQGPYPTAPDSFMTPVMPQPPAYTELVGLPVKGIPPEKGNPQETKETAESSPPPYTEKP